MILFEDEKGREYEAHLLAEFEFEHKKYALFKEEALSHDVDLEEEKMLVLMRILIEDKDGGTVYHSIDDEDEFQRVQEFIYNALLAAEAQRYPQHGPSRRTH